MKGPCTVTHVCKGRTSSPGYFASFDSFYLGSGQLKLSLLFPPPIEPLWKRPGMIKVQLLVKFALRNRVEVNASVVHRDVKTNTKG